MIGSARIGIMGTAPRVALLTLLMLLTGACSRSGSSEGDSASGSTASATAHDDDEDGVSSGLDPCALLETGEVETALGKLAGPPYRLGQDGPEAGGKNCRYDAADGRSIKLGAMTEGAGSIMKFMSLPAGMAKDAGMKGNLPLPGGATFAGAWDEARIVGCCILNAMVGDAMVDLDFTASRLDMKQAAALVNSALARLEKPVHVNGKAGVDAALAREKQRPKERPACQLVSRAEAQAVLGPLLAEPSGDGNECDYRFTLHGDDGKSSERTVQIKVEWRGGYASLREQVQMAGQIMGSLTGLAAHTPAEAPPKDPGPWEDSASTIHFMAVKKDVLVSSDLRLAPEEQVKKLVAKAVEKI